MTGTRERVDNESKRGHESEYQRYLTFNKRNLRKAGIEGKENQFRWVS